MPDPTVERRGLDALLNAMPFFDLLAVDWQLDEPLGWNGPGPWLMVTLGQRSDDGAHAWATHTYAIWKRTGAVHLVTADGEVIDPPYLRL